jgi:hypothetical protein
MEDFQIKKKWVKITLYDNEDGKVITKATVKNGV